MKCCWLLIPLMCVANENAVIETGRFSSRVISGSEHDELTMRTIIRLYFSSHERIAHEIAPYLRLRINAAVMQRDPLYGALVDALYARMSINDEVITPNAFDRAVHDYLDNMVHESIERAFQENSLQKESERQLALKKLKLAYKNTKILAVTNIISAFIAAGTTLLALHLSQ